MKLEHDQDGAGPRLLVLLHGLGATREVWQPMLALAQQRWHGRWIAPDLRGHGRSPHARSYALGLHAADVAELVRDAGDWNEVVLLGHSMGGAIALALASGWLGFVPKRVFGVGIKIAWTPDELSQLAKMSAAPPRVFETKDAAINRHLKVAGLTGIVAADSAIAAAGVAHTDLGWRLAADPATASVGPPPMRALLAATQTPVHLARGKADQMVSRDQLLEYDAAAVDLAGGHNAMVEHPSAVWQWLSERLA